MLNNGDSLLLMIPMLCWALLRCRNELIWNQKNYEIAHVVSLVKMTLLQCSKIL